MGWMLQIFCVMWGYLIFLLFVRPFLGLLLYVPSILMLLNRHHCILKKSVYADLFCDLLFYWAFASSTGLIVCAYVPSSYISDALLLGVGLSFAIHTSALYTSRYFSAIVNMSINRWAQSIDISKMQSTNIDNPLLQAGSSVIYF